MSPPMLTDALINIAQPPEFVGSGHMVCSGTPAEVGHLCWVALPWGQWRGRSLSHPPGGLRAGQWRYAGRAAADRLMATQTRSNSTPIFLRYAQGRIAKGCTRTKKYPTEGGCLWGQVRRLCVKKFFVRQVVCHNNLLMVLTLPPVVDGMNVGARISLQHKAQQISGQ